MYSIHETTACTMYVELELDLGTADSKKKQNFTIESKLDQKEWSRGVGFPDQVFIHSLNERVHELHVLNFRALM